jgi:diguanylate cyclase (GGDEF)-like protein
MSGLGLLMGLVFPFFVLALGVPHRYVLTPLFFLATIGAGLIVGAANHFLSRVVVGSRLQFMRSKMATVEETLRGSDFTGLAEDCTPEKCAIPVDSEDELGAVVTSFNRLVEAQAASHRAAVVASRFAGILSSHIELMPLVDAALGDLQSAGRFSASALCIVRDGELTTIAANGIADASELATSDLVARSYRTLDAIELDLPDEVRLDGGVVTFRPRSVVAYPLHIRLVPIGVVVLASPCETAPEDLRLIHQLLPNFAVALNNALSHERLQRVAAIDTLTGLYNRRFGLERLSQEFSRSVRSNEPLGVVLFDIDHFKAVNDTYGHATGDEVLKAVATSVKTVLREGDTLMRYGGEEFLAVLPGAGHTDIGALGERIRRVVESTAVVVAQKTIGVTISLGAVSYPSDDVTDLDDLIRRADAAMYDAKKAGRNRLAFATA